MSTLHSARARKAGTWILAIAACAFVATRVPFRDHGGNQGLVSIARNARGGLVLAMAALYGAGIVAWAARWRVLLNLGGVHLSLARVFRVTIHAQAAGIILPGGIGGDALRIGSIVQGGASLPIVAASVLLDRVIGLATLTTTAGFLLVVYEGFGPGIELGALALLPGALAIGMWVLRTPQVARHPFLDRGFLARTLKPAVAYAAQPRAVRAVLHASALSFAVSGAQLLVVRGLLEALGSAPTRETWVYLGTALAFVVGAIPLVPGGWGTSDAAFVYFLGKAGVLPSHALGACLLYRLFWYLGGLVGGIVSVVARDNAPTAHSVHSPVATHWTAKGDDIP